MRVLVAGELNADLIFSGFTSLPQPGRETLVDDFSLVLGSSSAICAAGLARLGTTVSFLGKAGADVLGRFCIDELARMGVDVSLVRIDSSLKTGITASFTSEDRALVTFPGAIAELTCGDVPAILANFRHLHVSSYYLQSGLQPGLAGLFQTARAAGLSISLDPGDDPSGKWSPAIWSAVERCDILLLNEVELAGLSRSDSITEGLRAVSKGPGIVVAKLGKRGCAAFSEGNFYYADAIDVRAIDTTGAGDCFNAGFLHLWLQGYPLESCLECGSICGGLSTQKLGGCAGQPGWPEVEQIMQHSGRYAIVSGTRHHDAR